MTTTPVPDSFESLPLHHRDVPGVGLSRYRVYADYAHYTIVEAESVIDALRASGMKQAYRVIRDSLSLQNVLDIKTFGGDFSAPLAMPVQPVATEIHEPVADVVPQHSAGEEVFISPSMEPETKS